MDLLQKSFNQQCVTWSLATSLATSPLKDLPRVLLLHSPDHQRDAWGPHAQFARRPATATLGIADEPGTLGDPGGGEGGNSFAKLVLQCFLCFQLGGPCFGGFFFDICRYNIFLRGSICLKCYAKACQNKWHCIHPEINIYIYTLYISEIWLDMWQREYISRLSKISKPLHGKSCLPPLSPSHQRKVAVGAAAAARLRLSPASCPARQRWEPLVQVRPKQLRSPLDLKLRLDVKAVDVSWDLIIKDH